MSASHIRGNVSSKAQVLKQEGLRVAGWRAWGGSNGPDWESRLFLSFILPRGGCWRGHSLVGLLPSSVGLVLWTEYHCPPMCSL